MADRSFRVKNGIGIGTVSFADINRNIDAGVTTLRHLKVTGIATVGIISAVDGNGAQGIVTFQSRIGIHSNGNQIVISSPSVGAGYTNSYELTLPPKLGTSGQTLTVGRNGQLGFTTAGLYEARYYVSSLNGDDNNDGKSLPFKTIKKAAQAASFRSFQLPGGRYIDAGNLLELNKEFIKQEVVGFITSVYPGLIGDPQFGDGTKCRRDVGYVVDAIVYDLSYGGNSKSVEAGNAYWNAGTSYVVGETQETIAAYRYINTLARYVVNNVAISTSYQTPSFNSPQVYDLSVTYDAGCGVGNSYSADCCADVVSAIGSYVGIVTSIIGIGTTAAPAINVPTTLSKPIAIVVEAGNYVEDNPILLYEDIAILGDNLRNTIIRPLNAGKDLFRVRNGCYVTNFAMKDFVDAAGIPQFTFDYAIAYDDPSDASTSRTGYAVKSSKPTITRSPYIQNCSILSFLGANGILVDGDKITTPNVAAIAEEGENPVAGAQPEFGKSIVANAFTMVSFGGIGWRVINEGYSQVVSCFQIFCKYGSLAQSGGYLSITNSATNFGYYALRSVGWSPNAFVFDRGRVAATGISGGLQTLKVIGVGRTDQDLYVLRFYNNALSDQTANFKPVVTQQTFNATTGISTSSDTFLISAHPFINGDSVVYLGDEGASPPKVIGGLVSKNQYYVKYLDVNSFQLYEDSSLTQLVNLTSGVVGIHTLQKGNVEFFAKEMLDTHNSYQVLGIGSTANPLNFISGRQITQPVTGGTAVGYALTYIPNVGQNGQLVVSVEASGGVRRFFAPTGSTSLTFAINDHSGSPVSVAVTSVSGISTYYTVDFSVDSTPSGTTVTNIAALPENYRLFFHRPSIVNSSSHTWEYSGSGIDYNALPQNGGKANSATEQVFELGGRVFSSGTNELGDFKIGTFITAFNRTGNIIFNNKVSIGVLESLRLSLSGGVVVEAFSTDIGLGDNEAGGAKNERVPTQLAVRTFLSNRLGNFIDKNVSTNAVPSSVVQLNANGQINADLIPPKVVNYYTANVSGGRTDLVNQIPATDLRNGDTVIEPGNGYVLISDVYSEYLILDSDTRNYNYSNGSTVVSTNSGGGAIGIVTAPPSNAVGYGTTGLVKGVLLGVNITNGGSGYSTPGIYTCFLDTVTGIGTSARATVTVGGGGTVTSVSIRFGGRYYASGNVLTVNDDSLIGGRTGGARFQASVNSIETRLYIKLTNNQKFTGSALLTDYITDGDAVAISTNTSVGYGKTFDPTDTSTGGSVDFANDRIIIGVSTFTNGDPVIYGANGGNIVEGLAEQSTYYIKRVGISSVELYSTFALSSKVDLTGSGTGTATLTRVGVNTSTNLIAFEKHGLGVGDAVQVSGSTPTGITTGGYYYVGVAVTNAFSLHNVRSDALASVNGLILNPVSIASTNGGTFNVTRQNVTYSATVNTSSNITDNWTVLASGTIDASNITSGTVSPSRLGSGSATDLTFLAGDSSFKKVVTSVGIGTTQPLQATGSSFDAAPGGIGINTYYGKVNLTVNRASGTGDTYSTLGVAKFKTSTFSVDADGAVQIKNSTNGDVDASTLGGQAGAYYLDPTNLTGNIPISKGGTGLGAVPSLGAILQGNGTTYDLVTAPTFGGNVTLTNNGRLFAIGVGCTNLSITGNTGIATIQNLRVTNEVVSGVTTFSSSGNNIDQTAGTAALNRLTVTGVTTVSTLFFESLGGTSGATIPYITNVNTVHSGIVTFTSSENNIQQQAGTALLNNLTVSGVSTFVSIVNFGTANFGTVNVTGTLTQANGTVTGVSTFSGSANNINQTAGTAALNRLTVAGVSTVARLVQTSNETSALQRLTVAGISTFTGQLNAGTISASTLNGTLGNTLTISSPLTGTSYNNSAAVSIGINATSANTANYVVQRGASGEFTAGAITATGLTLNGGGSTTSAQLTFSGATNNWINFGTTGVAAPAFTTRSVGTKIVLYNQIGASDVDYALGIEGSTLWSSVPTTTQQFKWYGGTTLAASLTGAGVFTASTDVRAPIYYDSSNTAYYLDPASTSVLNAINANGVIRLNSDSSYMIGTPSYGFRFNNNADTINALLVNNSGTCTAYADFRAPIFYDSGNTGYYVDPNGTSNIVKMYVGGASVSTGYNGLFATNQIGAASGNKLIYFYNDGTIIKLDAYDYGVPGALNINIGGNGGYTTIDASTRSPIFYDSNNTAYYVDPASGSILNGNIIINQGAVSYSTMDNTPVVGSITNNRLHVNGSIQLTNNDDAIVFGRGTATFLKDEELGFGWGGGWYMNDGTYLRVRGSKILYNDYIIRSDTDMRSPIYYDQNDINYYLDPNSYSRLNRIVLNQSRVDSSVYPIGHYTPGETVFELDPTWSNDQLQAYFNSGSVSWVADSTAPGGYAISIVGNVNVGGTGAYSSGFPYIPVDQDDIFYMECWVKNVSSNNSHYMGSIDYNQSFGSLGGNPGSYGYWVMSNSSPGAPVSAWVKYSGYITGFSASTTGTFKTGTKYFTPQALFNYSGGGTTYISGWKCIKVTQPGNRTIVGRSGSVTDNITYALDVYHPADYRQLRVRSAASPLIKFSGSYNSGNGAEIWQNSSGTVLLNINSSSNAFASYAGPYTVFNGSARAPIFYDSDNTSYYTDPASTSSINFLQTANQVVIQGSFGNNAYNSTTSARLMFGGGDADAQGNYYIGTNLENYGGNYNKLDIRWHTGIRMGAQPGYGGIRFYDTEDLGTQVFAIGKDGSYAQANQSMRAPIFYDLDNTGYYLDPTSTNSLRTVGDWRADSSAWTGEFSGKIQYHSNNWYFQYAGSFLFRNSGGTNVVEGDSSGNLWAYASSRSPIFYDYNNTGYYCDPASTSNLALTQTFDLRALGQVRATGWYGQNSSSHTGPAIEIGVSSPDSTNGYILAYNRNSGSYLNMNFNATAFIFAGQSGGFLTCDTSVRSPIFYDSNNTGYYVDPAGTSELSAFSSGTYTRMDLPFRKFNRQAYTGDSDYWTGTRGWGTTFTWDTAWAYGFGGFDIWGTSTGHPQGSGYIHAQGIQSGLHYATSNSSSAYGWQLVGAGNAGARLWYRGKWSTSTTNWYELAMYGVNVGGDLYASTFYDSDNTGYYVNPAGTARLNTIYCGDVYSDNGGWFRNYGSTGLYNQSYARGIWCAEAAGNTYGNYSTYDGGRNGWAGWGIANDFTFMGRDNTDCGIHNTNYTWAFYHTIGGLNGYRTSTTSGSYPHYFEGTIYSTGNVVAYSDERGKKEIKTIENALDKVIQLRGVSYKKSIFEDGDVHANKIHIGVIAQEVEKVVPEVVLYAEDVDKYAVDYGHFAGLFIEAFKDQQILINNLKEEIQKLKDKIGE